MYSVASGKSIILRTVTSTSTQLSGKQNSTIVLKSTLKFLFAERIKERIYNAPKVFTNHQKKKTQKNKNQQTYSNCFAKKQLLGKQRIGVGIYRFQSSLC